MRPLGIAIVCIVVLGGVIWSLQPARADLVVYCAHDALYAKPFLAKFTERTGIRVDVRYDTEATKSLQLAAKIAGERENPQCDVFWNNEPLGTIGLARQGLLLPYRGAGHARIPAAYKDPEGLWVGFGARFRVWIVHRPTVAATADAIQKHLDAPSLADVAIARPLYGTTRMHFTARWDAHGGPAARGWFQELRRRGIKICSGNATVKDLVSSGVQALGLTDTDDYFLAVEAGRDVGMVPATIPSVRTGTESSAWSYEADAPTICIPNTAAIIRGARNVKAAQKLIDYLASAESERELAHSRSGQVPLGPVDPAELPDRVRRLLPLVPRGYVFRNLDAASPQALAFLQSDAAR